MNKDIKQISQAHLDNAESIESIKQIQSQVAQLQSSLELRFFPISIGQIFADSIS